MIETQNILVKEVVFLKEKLHQSESQILLLQHQLAELRRMIFGAKSERFIPAVHPSQLSFDMNQPVIESPEEEVIIIDKHERKKKQREKPVRQMLPSSLPREVITIYPEGYDESTTETPIGKEVTEILEEIPGKFFVKRYERLKFAKSDKSGVIIGELPTRAIDKGLFGELLLTRIIIDKYCDHLPLYRQLQRFQRAGIKLSSSTVGDVPKQVCSLLELLYIELINQVIISNYLQADETPHPVLDANVKEKTHRGYLWVYRSVKQRLVLFDYNKSRGKDGPRKILKNFKGFLQSDGYSVYDEFGLKEEITLVGCMAHARRYFEKSLDSNKTEASYFISRLQEVYAVERTIREEKLEDQQIIMLRKEKSLPVLNELGLWLKDNIIHHPPQTPMGKAMAYSLSRWNKLTTYINHPLLEIDNNLVENAIRPTVLGRKNYLFSGSHEGAERSAMIYSFIGSCKINNINPSEWLADVLVKIKDTKSSELYTLLPNFWKKP